MRKILLGAYAVFLQTVLYAQVSQQWVKQYGTFYTDNPVAIKTDAGGNIYVLGTSNLYTSSSDMVLIKYNSAGTQLWAQVYNSPANLADEAKALSLDATGNVYVTGESDLHVNNSNTSQITTIKYNSSGVQQWVASYFRTDTYPSSSTSIAVDASGNVYVAGYTINGVPYAYDYITIKYNASGVEQWNRSYNGTANQVDIADFIGVDAGGNVYVTGESGGLLVRRFLTLHTYQDYVTIKYDTNGNAIWQTRYNGTGSGNDIPHAMYVDAAGSVYITGESNGGSTTGFDYATLKYTSDGTLLWASRFNGAAAGNDIAHGLAVDGSGNVYVTGSGNYGGGNDDYATVKYSSAGVQQWVVQYQYFNGGSYTNDQAFAIALDGNGTIYVTGQSNGDYVTVHYNTNGVQQWVARYNGSVNGDDEALAIAIFNGTGPQFTPPVVYVTGKSVGISGSADILTIKYTQPLVVAGGLTSKTMAGQLLAPDYKLFAPSGTYRDPAKIIYQLPTMGHVVMELYDMTGRRMALLVDAQKNGGRYEVDLNSLNLAKGVYSCRMIVNNRKEEFEKTVMVSIIGR